MTATPDDTQQRLISGRPPPPPYVQIAVALAVDGLFTYKAPPAMGLVPGHAVLVPFARRKVTGYVIENVHTTDVPANKLKSVSRLLDPEPVFDAEQLKFFWWVADYYMAGLGETIATALPARIKAKSRRVFRPTDGGLDALARESLKREDELQVLREVVSRPGRTRLGVSRALLGELTEDEVRLSLNRLLRKELVHAEEEESGGGSARVKAVRLTCAPDQLVVTGGARMRGVLSALVEAGGELDVPTLINKEGPGARGAIRSLEKRGLVETLEREDRRAASATEGDGHGAVEAPPPNAFQQAALAQIAEAAAQPSGGGGLLLHGVTGSGKTEVYLQAAAKVLDQGRQVLVLVPEIALTPQLVGRFRARFGGAVAVLHSGLTALDRLREWRRIRAGEATVAVGARSALFAPFSDLGLLVVDEEHDESYKQDDGVRYSARDMAVVRAHLAKCPAILGSATPSMETWANAHNGRYGLIRMPTRATPRPVPQIELVDLRGLAPEDPLSPRLIEAMTETLSNGHQAIVLFNRRGFAPVIECPGCGLHFTCPSCGVRMVLHKGRERVVCHYCGLHRPFSRTCTSCSGTMDVIGFGTERIAEAVSDAFPTVSVGRMDADTTAGRGSHARILARFRAGKDRILVGTQLVAKGHDFPNVQLAAVVGLDNILGLPDFRSAERTWALATQLAGRAGRGSVAGRVLLQTRHPDHFVFRLLGDAAAAAAGETPASKAAALMDGFYAEELRHRKLLSYPPFTRLALIRVEGADKGRTRASAGTLGRALQARVTDGTVQILGPVAAPLSRLIGRWRFQIVLRCAGDPRQFRTWLRSCRDLLRAPPRGGVRASLDVDPRHLL